MANETTATEQATPESVAAPVIAPAAAALPADGATPAAATAGTPGDVKPAEAPVGAPEAYQDFTVPSGYGIDDTLKTDFTGLAKELNLTQEQAQKLVNLGGKLSEKQAAANMEAFSKLREEWVGEIKNDKDYGGDQLDVTLERANRALRTFGSPKLVGLLQESGYGDNPELIKMFAKIDKATGEDISVSGDSHNTGGQKSDADLLYPK